MAIEKVITIKVDSSAADSGLKALQSQLDKTEKEAGKLNETTNETSKQGNVFGKMSGGLQELVPGFSGAVAGGQNMLKTMWLLVANPIGAVIAAVVLGLGLLYKAFASTNDGADKIEQTLAGLSAVVDILRDRVLKVGETIVKFFSGDFKGALASGKEAVNGFGAEVEQEFKRAAKATRYLQEVEDSLRSLNVSRAKLNRDLAETKEIITDENATFDQKRKAINDVRIAEERQTKQELANAKKKFDAIHELNDLSDTADKDLDKEAAALADLYKIQEEQSTNRRAVRKQELTLNRQEASEKKAIQDEANERQKVIDDKRKERNKEIKAERDKAVAEEKARYEKELADKLAIEMQSAKDAFNIIDELNKSRETPEQKELREYEAKKAILEENNLSTELLTAVHNENLFKIESDAKDKQKALDDKEIADKKAIADKEIEIDKQVAESKKIIQDAQLNNVAAGFKLLSQLAGKNKTAQAAAIIGENAVGIAKQIINTRAANALAKASPLNLATAGAYGTAQSLANNIALGLGIASSAVATKNALSALGKGGDTGGSQGGSGGQGSAPSFNLVQGTGKNQIAESLSKQAPIKAYVVTSDVTSGQSMDRNIVSKASLG
jgi:hypothetical protein